MILANTTRIAMAKQDQYSQFFNSKQTELARLDGRDDEIYKESWEFLRQKKRG